MTTLGVKYFDQVSYKLGKNCGFFNKSTFQHVSDFFWNRLYVNRISDPRDLL